MRETNVATVREVYRACAGGEMLQVIERLDDEVEWREPSASPYSGNHRGAVAVIRDVLIPLGNRWHLDPSEFLDAGDQIVVLGSAASRADAPDAGSRFVHVWRLREHRAVRVTGFYDLGACGGAS